MLGHMFQKGTRARLVQLTAFIDIAQVLGYGRALCAKQLGHLRLRQPYRFMFQRNFETDLAVGGGEDFYVLCHCRTCGVVVEISAELFLYVNNAGRSTVNEEID